MGQVPLLQPTAPEVHRLWGPYCPSLSEHPRAPQQAIESPGTTVTLAGLAPSIPTGLLRADSTTQLATVLGEPDTLAPSSHNKVREEHIALVLTAVLGGISV